jgi:dihydroneopterin aldolase
MTTDEIRAAFAHPAVRAEATLPGAAPLDRISLREHVREVEIGAFQQERGRLQRLRFDIVVEVAREGPVDDDVDRILSYDRLTEAIETELAAERVNLLETLAERIADRILLEPQAARVFVRIEKLDRGPGALGVEIVRLKGGTGRGAETLAPAPQPRVVHLGTGALHHAGLPAMLDRLLAGGAPVVLCVDAPDLPRPRSQAALAQRRIDLLAVEQAAWVLAGRDRRCIVVATRTELDWAMRRGQLCVWAPSKIVLDAVDGPKASDGLSLAAWFAGAMGALELRLIGSGGTVEAGVPVVRASVEAPL